MKQEVLDMACIFLRVKVDIVHYDLRPASANGYEDVAAALWARFKCRSLAYRDWALSMAVLFAEPNHRSEGEIFARASLLLDEWSEEDDLKTADTAVRGSTPSLPWVPTTVGLMRQYAIGDRTSHSHLRILNRPLQDRYASGGFEDSHISYLVNEGEWLYEHEVLAEGNCWLRAILMQIPQSNHGKRPWHADTGSMQSQSRTSKATLTIPSYTKKGVRTMNSLDKEIRAVATEVGKFISLNPGLFREAIKRATVDTDVEDSEPLAHGRVQYEFRQAFKLNSRAEDYAMPTETPRSPWITRLTGEFRSIQRPVIVLVVSWTTTLGAAEAILQGYEAGDWALSHKLGMVIIIKKNKYLNFIKM